MTEDQTPSPLRDDTDIILPAAAYLRYESRADGWSAGRQAACLAHLADSGRADLAVRSVGMSAQGGYALRRQARGYAFNLGWEAALIIARRIVADDLMTAAIRGETSCWVREEGKTTYTRQNTKLALTLLERVNPATAMPEVLAVAVRFDCFLQMIDDGLSAQELWEYFFDEVLSHDQPEARARVRAALQLSEESAIFDEEDEDDEGEDDEAPIEYKSMDGAPSRRATNKTRRPALDAGLGFFCEAANTSLTPHQVRGDDGVYRHADLSLVKMPTLHQRRPSRTDRDFRLPIHPTKASHRPIDLDYRPPGRQSSPKQNSGTGENI